MNDIIYAAFFCKYANLAEVRGYKAPSNEQRVQIAEVKEMTPREYDAFAASFIQHLDWLDGKGGTRNGAIQGILVTAEGRPSLIINPEGYDYARYVAIL